MSDPSPQGASDVAETLFIPLYFRAMEAGRPDGLVKDEKAAELVKRVEHDFSHLKAQSFHQILALLRVRQFDRWTGAFLAAHPRAVVVNIGCGLDTRFYRLDDGTVEWYDLDLPEAIAVRRQYLEESPRCRFIAQSALDLSWIDALARKASRPFLFLAEGVFPYWRAVDVRRLVLALKAAFPGAELVFDAVPPFEILASRFRPALQGVRAPVRWGLGRGDELVTWARGIRLLGQWHCFDEPEPRLGRYRRLRWFPAFGRGFRILRYRLGERGRVP